MDMGDPFIDKSVNSVLDVYSPGASDLEARLISWNTSLRDSS
jgi:hypothetical protein